MRDGKTLRARTDSLVTKRETPAWLITIDTEGDNLWSTPREIRTENAHYLPRFQELCEKNALRPTYLVNWEMACCPVFREFARDVIARQTAEIGMHLHAWNSPPLVPLTGDDYRWQPYLIEYPVPLMREKIKTITEKLRQSFAVPVVSHRAGRWALNEQYAGMLIEHDYRVDCSMTPSVSWRHDRGAPHGHGGVDYSEVPTKAFWMNSGDVRRAGSLPLLEIPMTIRQGSRHILARTVRRALDSSSLGRRVAERVFPSAYWFRPNRRNRNRMLEILRSAEEQQADFVEMMLHSSELMPGGSPYFPDENSIERLHSDLEALFSAGSDRFRGMTLAEYHERFVQLEGEPAVHHAARSAMSGGS